MRQYKYIHLLIYLLILCVSFSGCGTTDKEIKSIKENATEKEECISLNEQDEMTFSGLDVYEKILTNDTFSLAYNDNIGAFSVSANNENWYSVVTQELYDLNSSSPTWINYMQSILTISYAYKDETRGNVLKTYSAAMTTMRKVYTIDNGIRLQLDFTDASIRLILDIILVDTGIKLKIPHTGIEEYGDFILYSIELLPFFDSALNTDDGYLFYPDGSGALTYFNKTAEKNTNSSHLSLDIYGSMQQDTILSSKPTAIAMLPVCGAKNGNRAFLSAITAGDKNATICAYAATEVAPVKLNRVCFEFTYRNTYKIHLSNLRRNGKDSAKTLYGKKADLDILKYNVEVEIFLLQDEVADYSGMANMYRNYLIDNKLLVESDAVKNTNLSIDLFMGAYEKGTFPEYKVTTSYNDALKIIKGYVQHDLKGIHITLKSWDKNGFFRYPSKDKANRKLGGSSELKKLIKYTNEQGDFELSVEQNYVNTTNVGSFSIAKMGDSNPIANDDFSLFVLSPFETLSLYNKSQKLINKYDNLSLSLSFIGKTIYRDYDAKCSRTVSASIFSKMSTGAHVEGGNLYVLNKALSLYNLPEKASLHSITDETIPWIQMIYKGYLPYTTTSGNLSYDFNHQKLLWVEYGCIPYFQLTQNSPNILKNTNYNVLFSSENSVWFDFVCKTAKEFEESVSKLNGYNIIKHERINKDLTKIVYSNGSHVYVNYGDEEQKINNVRISANSYVVTKVTKQ